MMVPSGVAPMTGLMFSVEATRAFTPVSLPFFLSVSRLFRTNQVFISSRKASSFSTISSKGSPCSSSCMAANAICVSPQEADLESITWIFFASLPYFSSKRFFPSSALLWLPLKFAERVTT